jgi:hypothetical protein
MNEMSQDARLAEVRRLRENFLQTKTDVVKYIDEYTERKIRELQDHCPHGDWFEISHDRFCNACGYRECILE